MTQLFQEFVDREYIVTNAATYWLTGTIGSSVRRYFADANAENRPTEPTTAPTVVAIFREDFQTIRRLAERDHTNIVRWMRYDRGSPLRAH